MKYMLLLFGFVTTLCGSLFASLMLGIGCADIVPLRIDLVLTGLCTVYVLVLVAYSTVALDGSNATNRSASLLNVVLVVLCSVASFWCFIWAGWCLLELFLELMPTALAHADPVAASTGAAAASTVVKSAVALKAVKTAAGVTAGVAAMERAMRKGARASSQPAFVSVLMPWGLQPVMLSNSQHAIWFCSKLSEARFFYVVLPPSCTEANVFSVVSSWSQWEPTELSEHFGAFVRTDGTMDDLLDMMAVHSAQLTFNLLVKQQRDRADAAQLAADAINDAADAALRQTSSNGAGNAPTE